VAHSHSTPLHDIFNLIRDLGHPLEEVSYQQWRSHLTHINQVSTNDILIALMAIFPEEDIEITNKGKGPELDLSNTLAGLAGTDIVFPTIEKGLIQKYLSYFIMKGLVPKLNF
jgi:hypothetical protein